MHKGIKVVYVDDEPDLLEIARIFLEEEGKFQVTTSTSAPEMLESTRILSFDLILSDYQMPGMDGIAFLKEVRRRYGDIPFILFTGRGREEVVIEAINNGVDFYIQKGGDPTAQFAELAHKIRQAVSRRNAQEELRAAYEQIAAAEEELRSQYDELTVRERQVRENEKMFHELFDLVPVACTVTDANGRNVLVNRAFEKSSGYSFGDAVGKTSTELGIITAENFRKLKQAITTTGKIRSDEMTIQNKNGETRTILVSSQNVIINRAPHFISAILDITDRKLAETALRESEDRFRAMIDQSPFSIIVFSPSGDVVHVNEAHLQLWGITREETMKFNAFHDPQLEKLGLFPVFRRAFAGERVIVPPLEYNLPDALGRGQKKTVRGDFYPIHDTEGHVTHVILVHQDFAAR